MLPPACSVGYMTPSMSLSTPEASLLHPSPSFGGSLGLLSNGTTPGPYGPVAHLRCPLHYTYFLGAHPHTLFPPSLSHGTT